MKKQRGRFRNRKTQHGTKSGVVRPTRSANIFARGELLIAAVIAAATLAVYGQVITHQFINFDDDLYVRDNPMVNGGVTVEGIVWAFTTFHSANWHPLTWLSHMIDCQLFGLKAGGHLLVSALIHVTNSILLFFLLKRVTEAKWSSAIVAALFALHPLHVESVAWAAERKDTLSTFFGLLCLLAYVRYAERPSWRRYTLVAVWLGLGLMAKPMLVSWPFVLLLLDYWPLQRIVWQPTEEFGQFLKAWWPLIREKVPLFTLAAISMIVTYVAQAHGEAVADLIAAPISWRLANSLVSYAKYLLLSFWPYGLAIYYPASEHTASTWQWVTSLVLLSAISIAALRNGWQRPYLISGWLWFLGTLVPVIGLVQVGSQAMADRYTYVPSIGLFVAVVFGLADLAENWRLPKPLIAIASALALLLLSSLTAIQVSRWRDSLTLFPYVLSVTSNNRVVENNLGSALGQTGKHAEAIPHFAEALRIKPDYLDALGNMGLALLRQGKSAEAIGFYEQALRLNPNSGALHLELGQALIEQGKKDEALQQFLSAVELAPNDFDVRRNIGQLLTRLGRLSEATSQLDEAVRLKPNSAEAHNDLGTVLMMAGRPDESIAHFSRAVSLRPDLAVAQENLRRAQKERDQGKQ